MRTPNCQCIVCGKPMYRRPNELSKVRHVACMTHRALAQKLSGITHAQQAALLLGRRKGTNNLTGIPKSTQSNFKRSEAMKLWAKENPELLASRGAKVSGELNWQWKGGTSKLSQTIRQMTEYRKWMDAVKARDIACVRCGSKVALESHHKRHFSELLKENNITSTADARACAALWDIANGETLCEEHHYHEHGRNYENRRKNISEAA